MQIAGEKGEGLFEKKAPMGDEVLEGYADKLRAVFAHYGTRDTRPHRHASCGCMHGRLAPGRAVLTRAHTAAGDGDALDEEQFYALLVDSDVTPGPLADSAVRPG